MDSDPPRQQPRPPVPEQGATAADAFEQHATAIVRDFRAHARRLRRTGDADALHQAHVALRRLRSLLALYDDAVTARSQPAWDRLRADFRTLAHAFGTARRLDVLLATYGADRAVRARFADAQKAARAAADAAASHSGPLLRRLAAQAATAAAFDPVRATQPLAVFVAPRLARWHRWLRRHGRSLSALPPPARHAIRLRIKRLRYAADFAAPAFADERAVRRRARQMKALTGLQNRLGDLNDLAEAAAMLDRPDILDPARCAALLAAAERHFRRIDRSVPFWAGA